MNPAISAEATRKALTTAEVAAANRHDASEERAALDEAELRDLERAEYYFGPATVIKPAEYDSGTLPVIEPEPMPAAGHRGMLDRLFGRRRG